MVSPSEIAKESAALDQAILASAERGIDAALRKEFGNKPEVWIRVPGDWTTRIRQEIIRRYEAAGWAVRFICDQRDGNALVFSAGVELRG